jgi:hypothetical protein
MRYLNVDLNVLHTREARGRFAVDLDAETWEAHVTARVQCRYFPGLLLSSVFERAMPLRRGMTVDCGFMQGSTRGIRAPERGFA